MEVLHATLRAVEAASRPDASQADLNHLGQLFDQVNLHPFLGSTVPAKVYGHFGPLFLPQLKPRLKPEDSYVLQYPCL